MRTKKKLVSFIVCLLVMGACTVREKSSTEFTKTFNPSWESLISNEIPEWLIDAKFGIYAHWGVYAVPAYFTEHYGKRMYDVNDRVYRYHLENWGDPADFGYKEFIPMFRAEHYNPAEWVDLIKKSGAKYAGLATVHHDGFCIWDTKYTRWNSVNMGPKRDLFGDLATELKKNGIPLIATFHHIRTFDWYLPWTGNFWTGTDSVKRAQYADMKYDIFDPSFGDLYWNEASGRKREDFVTEWRNKVTEVLDKYEPDIIWFDGGAFRDPASGEIALNLLAFYYNKQVEWQKPLVVLNKLPGSMVYNFPYEFGILSYEEGRDRQAGEPRPWIDDMKIGDQGWGYNTDQVYKKAQEIIHGLIDRVSRGGGLLLNLSPKADGTIPEEQKTALIGIGDWLATNGEAIYGTRPWKIHSEGPLDKFFTKEEHPKWTFTGNCNAGDIRFTTKNNCLYVIALGWPDNMELTIKSITPDNLATKIKRVTLLGSDKRVKWSVDKVGTHVILPEKVNDVAVALKFELRN